MIDYGFIALMFAPAAVCFLIGVLMAAARRRAARKAEQAHEAAKAAREAERDALRAARAAERAQEDEKRKADAEQRNAARAAAKVAREARQAEKRAQRLQDARTIAELTERTLNAEKALQAEKSAQRMQRSAEPVRAGDPEPIAEPAPDVMTLEAFAARFAAPPAEDPEPIAEPEPAQAAEPDRKRPPAQPIPEEFRQAFAGEVIAFSGRIPTMTRSEAIAATEARGGRAFFRMPAGCTLLILGEDPGAGKQDAAARRGVPVLTWEEWFRRAGISWRRRAAWLGYQAERAA